MNYALNLENDHGAPLDAPIVAVSCEQIHQILTQQGVVNKNGRPISLKEVYEKVYRTLSNFRPCTYKHPSGAIIAITATDQTPQISWIKP